MKVCKLTLQGAMHIGDHRPNDYNTSETFIHSDTLYAALASVAYQTGHPQLVDTLISSAFPFIDVNGTSHYFLPKPLSAEVKGNELDLKQIKRIKWLERELFEDCLNQGYCIIKNEQYCSGEFAFSKFKKPEKWEGVYVRDQMQRVQIPRIRESEEDDAQPFYMERVYFGPGAGLYFFVDSPKHEADLFSKLFKQLKREGLGTDRNVGLGQFNFDVQEALELKIPEHATRMVTLGLVCPTHEEIGTWLQAEHNAAYSLTKRGGWITSAAHLTIRKKSIYMFTEGSCFPDNRMIRAVGNPHIDLTPESYPTHPVIRNGRSLVLPMI